METSRTYKTFGDADLAFLVSVCGKDRVIPGPAVGEDFCHDELSGTRHRPDAMVKVLSADEVSRIMKYADAECITSRCAAPERDSSAARSPFAAASSSTSPA